MFQKFQTLFFAIITFLLFLPAGIQGNTAEDQGPKMKFSPLPKEAPAITFNNQYFGTLTFPAMALQRNIFPASLLVRLGLCQKDELVCEVALTWKFALRKAEGGGMEALAIHYLMWRNDKRVEGFGFGKKGIPQHYQLTEKDQKWVKLSDKDATFEEYLFYNEIFQKTMEFIERNKDKEELPIII